ncbi:hypothetical protein PR202_ga05642 [Eleusine coracana subsp. coracana]|uniref:Uncharacterized protein n=1 Tax=Eleusine coracana subsp. coracana TaxID=191504 RepID=A0AAV5BS52_ELECO|nr:hypothetical protein PR202_ga05188 [Eleusine coracana subsp. coracana]GJM89447.1 hypothetical protein PR202_ga05642 [Eleusine coracana subsp. coracana]
MLSSPPCCRDTVVDRNRRGQRRRIRKAAQGDHLMLLGRRAATTLRATGNGGRIAGLMLLGKSTRFCSEAAAAAEGYLDGVYASSRHGEEERV